MFQNNVFHTLLHLWSQCNQRSKDKCERGEREGCSRKEKERENENAPPPSFQSRMHPFLPTKGAPLQLPILEEKKG